MKSLISQIDTDGDGRIDFDEVCMTWRTLSICQVYIFRSN